MNQQSPVAPRLAGGAVALPASSYWRYIVPLCVLMITVIGARAHESVPFAGLLRPAVTVGLVGGLLAYFNTSQAVIARALNDGVFRGVAMYFAWAAVTVPFALWKGGAFGALRAYLPGMVLTFVLLLCPPTRETFDKLQRGFVLACLAAACVTLVLGRVDAEGRLGTRGSFDANDVAAVMAMSLPLALGLVARERSWLKRLFWIGASGIQLTVLMRAGSRGAFIALFVGSLFFIMGQRGKRRWIFALLSVVAGIAIWTGASPRLRERFAELASGTADYNFTAYAGRRAVWARARGYMMDHPVFGVGVGNFQFAEGETCRKLFPDQGCKWSNTHNSWLQAGAELGVPGMILFVLMLLRGAREAWRLWVPRRTIEPHQMHLPELFAALIGFATAATFLSHAYFYLAFGLLGLIAMAALTTREAALAAGVAPALPTGTPGVARGPRPRPFAGPAPRPLQPLRPAPPPRPMRAPIANPAARGIVRAARPLPTRRSDGRPRP